MINKIRYIYIYIYQSEFTLSEADDLDKIFNDSNNYSQSSSSISKVYSKNYRDYRRICNDKYTV